MSIMPMTSIVKHQSNQDGTTHLQGQNNINKRLAISR